MFISSMASKNRAQMQELSKPTIKQRRKKEEEFILTGESSVLLTRQGSGINPSYQNAENSHHLAKSGKVPKSNVELLLNTNASAHNNELQLNAEEFEGFSDLYDRKEENMERKQKSLATDHSWFTSPVHRPNDESIPYSELVQVKPLTASVLKAKTEGTLLQDYTEDMTGTQLDEFDMKIFQKADRRIYRAQLENAAEFASPYHFELAKLKREKLKLEETYLLKLRCQAELEATRGPKPKWYELKTRQFNKELKKNNDIVDNSQTWRGMAEYQNEVIAASGRWENLQQ